MHALCARVVINKTRGMQMYENAAHNKILRGSRCKRARYESEFQRLVTAAAVFYLHEVSGKSAT